MARYRMLVGCAVASMFAFTGCDGVVVESGAGAGDAGAQGAGGDDAGEPGDGEREKALLDACGLPALCPPVEMRWNIHPLEAGRCVWATMAEGTPVHVSADVIIDGGGSCTIEQESYVGEDRTAIVWTRMHHCSREPGVEYEIFVRRCKLVEPAIFLDCVDDSSVAAENGPFNCHYPYDWFTECVDAEPACP